jgi:hypothetical protein
MLRRFKPPSSGPPFGRIVQQQTNVMHFLYSLLSIKGLYMFRALLAHPQEVLHIRHLVYCVRVVSVGCTRIGELLLKHLNMSSL